MGQYFDTYFSPNGGAADYIVKFIDKTSATLDIAVYSLTHDLISDAIIRAQKRGVKIRFLTDDLQSKGGGSDDEKLEAAGVLVRRDTQSGLMHHKFVISDQNALGLGSFNWSINADKRNMENWNVCRIKYVIEDYQKEFEKIWDLNKPKAAPPTI
jgi:phosphatidylserine/phosphatidylglycerophosphate/cardiolipin synthase-like enzyme